MPTVEEIVNRYVDTYGEDAGLVLLKVLAHPSAGGEGYVIRQKAIIDADGWEVDTASKVITLDTTSWGFSMDMDDLVENLNEAVETDILQVRMGLLPRLGWGTGKVLLGAVETVVGVVGIIVPEPGTTAAGVSVTILGANSIGDGISQLAGANRGHGYNILGEASGALGSGIARAVGSDPKLGEAIGKGVFLVTSVTVGSLGSIRILKIPGTTFARLGVGGQRGGAVIGRIDLLYGSSRAKDGMTIININNNAGQSILRFVTHDGRLMANARIGKVFEGSKIIQGQKILRHATSGKEILKGLLQLAAHGAVRGI
ncbi:MAG TPA: hypothetical protein ENJ17_05305 [Gammaproteobacteria bacterium]|nr:hypothetical protein [Gammaproteobacteria bacterium]